MAIVVFVTIRSRVVTDEQVVDVIVIFQRR